MHNSTIKKTVFQFSELSERAKERARTWYRSSDYDDFFSESICEYAATIGDILGIDLRVRRVSLSDGGHMYNPCIYYSGFSSQGDGACFEGSYRYKKGAYKALAAHIGGKSKGDKELLRIAKELQNLQSRYFYSLTADMKHSGHYYHSGCMQVDVNYQRDDSRDTCEAEDDLTQLMRDFADWIYRQLETEYDYQNSDSTVNENIEANEYEFTENGDRA